MKEMLLGIAASTLMTQTAMGQAQPKIEIGYANFQGAGCEQETLEQHVSIRMEHNTGPRISNMRGEGTIIVNFHDYTVTAGEGTPRSYQTKRCLIDLLLKIPNGHYVIVEEVKYSGYAVVPPGGLLSIQSSASFNFVRAVDDYHQYGYDNRNRAVGYEGEVNISTPMEINSRYGTNCPNRSNLIIDSTMIAQTNIDNDFIIGMFSTAEARGTLFYNFSLRPCP